MSTYTARILAAVILFGVVTTLAAIGDGMNIRVAVIAQRIIATALLFAVVFAMLFIIGRAIPIW